MTVREAKEWVRENEAEVRLEHCPGTGTVTLYVQRGKLVSRGVYHKSDPREVRERVFLEVVGRFL